jgi:glycosyltransferase involved in cell wall biosynthesis
VLEEFGWPDDAQIVLFAGRLDRAIELDHPQNHKNSWFALNVARAASLREPRFRLLMAGAGERKELEHRIAQWGVPDRLKLIGIRRDIPRLMRAADALLFPSRQEGLGMVAVEAQAAGLPVLVSTAVPREAVVIPELVQSLPLSEPFERWAETLLHTVSVPRKPAEVYRSAMEGSDFAIANSAQKLLRVYTSGCRAEGRFG